MLDLVDTHSHINFDQFAGDFDEMLTRASDAGVRHIVVIGAGGSFESNESALELARQHDWLSATVGIHPHDAQSCDEGRLAILEEWARLDRVVAVGETGLDYHYDRSPRDVQRAAFRRFVQMARRVGKPVVVHSRDAEEQTIEILREEGAEECGGIIHCFSGTETLARAALDLGFYLSFSGIVTFPGAKIVRAVAAAVPADRILVETDAPYLAPVPQRGKRNEPAFVEHTLRELARLRGVEPDEMARATTQNARRLLGVG